MAVSPALPGLRAIDHVGFVVPDLDAAVRFFVDALGGEEIFRHGPYGDPAIQEAQFARHPDTVVVGIAMIRLGPANVELLQMDAPDQDERYPRTSDCGGHHLALYTDDLDAAIGHLSAHGARVLGEPMALPGPESGVTARFIFLLTPWGLPLELVTYPGGKRYEGETARRLFDPRRQPPLT